MIPGGFPKRFTIYLPPCFGCATNTAVPPSSRHYTERLYRMQGLGAYFYRPQASLPTAGAGVTQVDGARFPYDISTTSQQGQVTTIFRETEAPPVCVLLSHLCWAPVYPTLSVRGLSHQPGSRRKKFSTQFSFSLPFFLEGCPLTLYFIARGVRPHQFPPLVDVFFRVNFHSLARKNRLLPGTGYCVTKFPRSPGANSHRRYQKASSLPVKPPVFAS